MAWYDMTKNTPEHKMKLAIGTQMKSPTYVAHQRVTDDVHVLLRKVHRTKNNEFEVAAYRGGQLQSKCKTVSRASGQKLFELAIREIKVRIAESALGIKNRHKLSLTRVAFDNELSQDGDL